MSYPTRDDYFNIGAEEVLARSQARPEGQRLSRSAVYTEGTDINIIIAAGAAMADEGTRQMAIRMSALYLDSAEDEDLDRLVADRFSPDVYRKQAALAVVALSISRATGGPAVSLDAGTKVRTKSGVEFALTQGASLGVGQTGPVLVPTRATSAGEAGNVERATVTSFVSIVAEGLLVTNPEAATGGASREPDEQFRYRAKLYPKAQIRGSLEAITFGALKVPGVVSATAFEELDTTGSPTGRVLLTVADASGRCNALLREAVLRELKEYRAAGVPVSVVGGTPVYSSVAYSVSFRAGTDTVAAISQLRSITVSAVNALWPGDPLQRSLLLSLARSVPGVNVTESAIVTPPGDLIPSEFEVIKTSPDLVTVNGF